MRGVRKGFQSEHVSEDRGDGARLGRVARGMRGKTRGDEEGQPVGSNDGLKVIEVVLDQPAHGSRPGEMHLQYPRLPEALGRVPGSRGVGSAASRWEEDTVPFLTDLGKRAGRRRQRIRDKREIAHGRGPFHLRRVADEGAGKATVDGVVVPDLDLLLYATPDDFERRGPWCRVGVVAIE
jgi:hypothetical protein